MDLFERVLGGQQGGPPPQQQRQEFQDFVGRYEQGPPWMGVSDQEAVQRYQQVAPHLSPQEYRESAQEAFARLSPQERQQFGQYLRQRAQQQGVDVPDFNRDGIDDRLQDPAYLAQTASQLHQQQPTLLGQLLGGGSSGSGSGGGAAAVLGNPLAKAALAGIAAVAVKRMMSGR